MALLTAQAFASQKADGHVRADQSQEPTSASVAPSLLPNSKTHKTLVNRTLLTVPFLLGTRTAVQQTRTSTYYVDVIGAV